MEVREVSQWEEIICTSVLRTVNGSQCKEVPSLAYRPRTTRQTPPKDPNRADGNKCEVATRKLWGVTVVTYGRAEMDAGNPEVKTPHDTWSLWRSPSLLQQCEKQPAQEAGAL